MHSKGVVSPWFTRTPTLGVDGLEGAYARVHVTLVDHKWVQYVVPPQVRLLRVGCPPVRAAFPVCITAPPQLSKLPDLHTLVPVCLAPGNIIPRGNSFLVQGEQWGEITWEGRSIPTAGVCPRLRAWVSNCGPRPLWQGEKVPHSSSVPPTPAVAGRRLQLRTSCSVVSPRCPPSRAAGVLKKCLGGGSEPPEWMTQPEIDPGNTPKGHIKPRVGAHDRGPGLVWPSWCA